MTFTARLQRMTNASRYVMNTFHLSILSQNLRAIFLPSSMKWLCKKQYGFAKIIFSKNEKNINYPLYKVQGRFNESGGIEKRNKMVLQNRLKLSRIR